MKNEGVISLAIPKILVIQRHVGTDLVSIHTMLPSTMPGVTDEPLQLDFSTVSGGGVEYVRREFGIEPEVIKA